MRDWAEACEIALAFPETVEARSYGEPSLKTGRSLVCRLRLSDASLVILDVPTEEREMLLEADPSVFFLEDHYRDHAIVLAHLGKLDPETFRAFVERRWRNVASKRAIRTFEERRPDRA